MLPFSKRSMVFRMLPVFFVLGLWVIFLHVDDHDREESGYITDYVVEMVLQTPKEEKINPKKIRAKAAALVEAKTGRVLWQKDGDLVLPMASTTKVMTCLVALKEGQKDALYEASRLAASMPKVKLGVKAGEVYKQEDLLYALMLESYNDAAVVLAEGIAGSVEGFSEKMNEKAKSLGLIHTHFVTPNGLDAKGHETTPVELARLMAYAINEPEFLKITQTKKYTFSDTKNKRRYALSNHNTLFSLYDDTISGKTGYTANAGYCYTGAVKIFDVPVSISLLGCGWPPQKTYKWADCLELISYCKNSYKLCPLWEEKRELELKFPGGKSMLCTIKNAPKVLVSSSDTISVVLSYKLPKEKPLEVLGVARFFVNDYEVGVCKLIAK